MKHGQRQGLGNVTNGKVSDKIAAEFTAKLLYGAANLHYLHLMSPSHAKHNALGELYDCLPGLVDTVIEQFQGIHGVIGEYPMAGCKYSSNPITFVQELYDYVENVREGICQTSHIQSDIDMIQAAFASTLYKLKSLA